MSLPKRPFRKEPKPGEVLLIPVAEDCFAYLLMLSFCRGWMYDFYTTHPTKHVQYFERLHLKLPLDFTGRFGVSFPTVSKLELTEDECMSPARVLILTPDRIEFHEAATPYKLIKWDDDGYVTKEEADRMFRYIDLKVEQGEVETFIRSLLPELRRIEVPPADRGTPPAVADKPTQADDGPVLVEVHFQCQPEDMGLDVSDSCKRSVNRSDL